MAEVTKRARLDLDGPSTAVASASVFPDPHAPALTMVRLTNSSGAIVEAYTFGAHVVTWKASAVAENLLFMSSKAILDGSKAIRGGIPICWPQFGPGPCGPYTLPKAHGFARTATWALQCASTDGSRAQATFTLSDSPATMAVYPHKFELEYTVALSADGSLTTSLRVKNVGDTPMPCQALLHNYFRVEAPEAVAVRGFEGLTYTTTNEATPGQFVDERSAADIAGREIDRIYQDAPSNIVVTTHHDNRAVHMSRLSPPRADTVLWNPHVVKARELADFDDTEYQTMVCVEPGLINHPEIISPGENMTFCQVLSARL